jgi:hypothetical protein
MHIGSYDGVIITGKYQRQLHKYASRGIDKLRLFPLELRPLTT